MAYDSIWWNFVSFFLPIVEIFMTGYCFYRFAKPFTEKKVAVCVGAAYALTMTVLYFTRPPIHHFTGYSMGVFAAFLVMCQGDRKNYAQKIFVSVTFFSLRWLTSAMAEISYDSVYHFAGNTDYMKVHPNLSFPLYVVACIFYFAVEFLLMAASIWCILRNYVHKYARMSKKELIMMAVPSLLGAVGYEVIWCYRNFYIRGIGKTSAVYDYLSLFYYASAILMIVVAIVLYENIKTGQEEKLQEELLAAQTDSIKQHIEKVENLYRDICGIKHDMTNHILTLERLYAGNKTKEAIDYKTQLSEELGKMTNKINSGNPITDVILQEIQSEAKRRKICFEMDFHYPFGSNVNAFDVSVILNNALQNSLENTKEGKDSRISIFSYRRNNAYMIEVTNSFTGTLQWDTQKELPITSKENRDGHGYGLPNIRRVAEKYSGDIDISSKDGEFHLGIMLMLKR